MLYRMLKRLKVRSPDGYKRGSELVIQTDLHRVHRQVGTNIVRFSAEGAADYVSTDRGGAEVQVGVFGLDGPALGHCMLYARAQLVAPADPFGRTCRRVAAWACGTGILQSRSCIRIEDAGRGVEQGAVPCIPQTGGEATIPAFVDCAGSIVGDAVWICSRLCCAAAEIQAADFAFQAENHRVTLPVVAGVGSGEQPIRSGCPFGPGIGRGGVVFAVGKIRIAPPIPDMDAGVGARPIERRLFFCCGRGSICSSEKADAGQYECSRHCVCLHMAPLLIFWRYTIYIYHNF